MLNENDLEEGVVYYRKEESSLALFKYNFLGIIVNNEFSQSHIYKVWEMGNEFSYRYFKLKVIYVFVNTTKQR